MSSTKITLKKINNKLIPVKKIKKLTKRELAKENFPAGHIFFIKNKKDLEPKLRNLLQRFTIRYRLSKSFEGLKFKDNRLLGKTYFKGYDIGMKIFLTYTAYELVYDAGKLLELEQLIPHNNRVELDKPTVDNIRKNKKLIALIEEFYNALKSEKNNSILKNISKLKEGNNDVLGLGLATRNLFAHGVFTPVGAGISEENIADYIALDKVILKYINGIFLECSRIVNDKKLIKTSLLKNS